MTEINEYNGAFLPDDDTTDCCQTCNGRGGNTSTQDPVGDGVGFETLFDPCPDCIGKGLCPGCLGPITEWECQNGCGWTSEDIDAYDNEPSWGDYPDDDPGFDPRFLM